MNLNEPYIYLDILDGWFSEDGNYFVVATMSGTLSIYSIFPTDTYYGTPNEQIYHLDFQTSTGKDTYLKFPPKIANISWITYGV